MNGGEHEPLGYEHHHWYCMRQPECAWRSTTIWMPDAATIPIRASMEWFVHCAHAHPDLMTIDGPGDPDEMLSPAEILDLDEDDLEALVVTIYQAVYGQDEMPFNRGQMN